MQGMARRLECMRQELAAEFYRGRRAPALNRSWAHAKVAANRVAVMIFSATHGK